MGSRWPKFLFSSVWSCYIPFDRILSAELKNKNNKVIKCHCYEIMASFYRDYILERVKFYVLLHEIDQQLHENSTALLPYISKTSIRSHKCV